MGKIKFSTTYIIAELGGNHDGNQNYMYEGILNAKKSGANAIKFQFYNANGLIHPNTPLMKNVKNSKTGDRNQYYRYKRLELPKKNIPKLYRFAKKNKIDFGLSVFDHRDVKFASNYCDFFKIASGDIEYFQLMKEMIKFDKKIILSTGLSNLKIIDRAMNILKKNKKEVNLMHCICSYPTQDEDYNLNSINVLKKKYKDKVSYGISDHTKGDIVATLSCAIGATYVEKHFLPNQKVKKVGDFKLSLNPLEFNEFTKKIRKIEKTLGYEVKKKFPVELPFEKSLRRSIYASKDIIAGNNLSINDIQIIRPYEKKGINAFEFDKFIGKKICKNLKKNELITKIHFKKKNR